MGDPFGATTHTDLQLRAREKGIPVRVIHNASVMNAVGACGLQLYRFGEVRQRDRCERCEGALSRTQVLHLLLVHGAHPMLCAPHHGPHSTPAQAVSIVFFTDSWRPDSFYDKIAANRKMGLHTLCLLDIKVRCVR